MSETLFHLGHYDEAEAACQKGLDLDPRDEVLLLRQRDCNAMDKTKDIETHPTGQSLSALQQPGTIAIYLKKVRDLNPDANDIKIVQSKSELERPSEINTAHFFMALSCGLVVMEKKAFALFQEAGERGNAEGLYNLAIMYKKGQAGVNFINILHASFFIQKCFFEC